MNILAMILGAKEGGSALELYCMKRAVPKKLAIIRAERGACTNPRLERWDVLLTDEACEKLEAMGALELLKRMKEDGEFLRGGCP